MTVERFIIAKANTNSDDGGDSWRLFIDLDARCTPQ